MRRIQRNKRQISRWFSCGILFMITNLGNTNHFNVSSQSIGYHPQFNFGFNPYFSPAFGYGLGLPFGANNISPTRYPWLLNSIPITPIADKNGLMSKIHAKAVLTKLATSQILSPSLYSIKDKLNLMKHPENMFTPYGASYGYGKHYGAAVLPNNPYKNVYSDYYDNVQPSRVKPMIATPIKQGLIPVGGKLHDGSNVMSSAKHYTYYLKPFMKAGALLTTAAILSKKISEVPMKLNPTGLIIDELRPQI